MILQAMKVVVIIIHFKRVILIIRKVCQKKKREKYHLSLETSVLPTKSFGKSAGAFRLFVTKVVDTMYGGYEVRFFKRPGQTMKFIEREEHAFKKASDIERPLSKPMACSSTRFKDIIWFSTDLSDLTNIH